MGGHYSEYSEIVKEEVVWGDRDYIFSEIRRAWNEANRVSIKSSYGAMASTKGANFDSFGKKKKEPAPPISFSSKFIKSVKKIDSKMRSRLLLAITDIMRKPYEERGNTVKALKGEKKGFYRYRIGDYRIIYFYETDKNRILLSEFATRSGVYS